MAGATVIRAQVNNTPFPLEEMEACIRDFLKKEVTTEANLHGRSNFEPVIDSLEAVMLLTELEEKFPFTLPDSSIVRPGGYMSIDDAVTDFIPKLERHWREHYGG